MAQVVLQIGAGGVGSVVAHKMAMNRSVFGRIILASRRLSSCALVADSIKQRGLGEIEIEEVDADDLNAVLALIHKYKPALLVNTALPYQDLVLMEACLQTGTHYLDTANYEHPDSAHFEYKEQWAFDKRYKEAGLFALLGSGFDPGVTNVFCAYAAKHYFDEIHEIDILDCNAGDHGYAFATNFNPEINLREVSSKARYWQSLTPKDSKLDPNDLVSKIDLDLNPDLSLDTIYRRFDRPKKHFALESNTQDLRVEPYCGGQWRDLAPLSLMKSWDYPELGARNSYLLYHEELESLIRNIKGLKRIRFFMTFGESYLTHMKCLENVGLLRIDEVEHKGSRIVPLELLKTLLPDPASLAPVTKGSTHIGCYFRGIYKGAPRILYIYNICDHEACFKEVGAQGVSYTTGVPAMIGAKLICEGRWGLNQPKTPSKVSNDDLLEGARHQGIDNSEELQRLANKPGLSRGAGVWNMEQNDPDPFMEELNKQGLPFVVLEVGAGGEARVLEDGRAR